MTLAEAIDVLNKSKHRGIDSWGINEHGEVCPLDCRRVSESLTYFTVMEAIAIAVFIKRVLFVK